MVKLLLMLLLLLAGTGLVASLVLGPALQRADVDAFYTRFTTPPAGSLVLGTSRAAQAVQPTALQAKLGTRYAGPWLNYAFTLTESPYGPAYLRSIQRKLASNCQHGLFILTVDPWALSLHELEKPGETPAFPEEQGMVGQMHLVNLNPNVEYLGRFLHRPLYQLLRPDHTNALYLHPDGWLEVKLPSPTEDTTLLQQRIESKLLLYRTLAANSHLSAARLAALRQLVALLQPHGRVVLVRLPTGPAMVALEAKYQPRFDSLMQQTGTALGVPYLNYIGQQYPTTDGNHLWRGAAQGFSERLATDIGQL